METLQRFLAWYLGLRLPGPGEGTAWRFDWHLPEPHWLVLVISIAILLFVIAIYRRDGSQLRSNNRMILTGLRLAVVGLILGLMTELSLTIERTGLPIVAVMIDTSASMSLQDQYPPNSKAARLVDDVARETGGQVNRLTIAQHLLTRNHGQLLEELQRRHQIRIYHFDETASALESGDLGQDRAAEAVTSAKDQFSAILKEIQQLQPDGDQTRPSPATKKVLGDLRGAAPAAIVLLTDGVATVSDTDKLSTIAETVRRKGVQLHLIGIGSDSSAKDLNLYDTLVDEVAFVGDPMLFKAKLRSFGFSGKKISLELRKEGERDVLITQDITAPADGQTVDVELSYASEIAGEFDYVLEVRGNADETNPLNNAETRHVSVREEKIRVLLVDSAPRYEFRFLKQLLERDKSIEVSTLLQDADLEYSQEDRTAISHFPVKKEDLARLDVLILGDLAPAQLSNAALENVREFVREKGGSVIFIAGPQFNPVTFAGTPLESLLPFELSSIRMPGDVTTENFHPVLTLEGQKGNSLFRLGNSEADSQQIWTSLPNFTWLVEISKLKPSARVFAEHPTKNGANGRLPVILMQQAGAGKVLFHATDETWRWRFRTGDLYHGRYWIQAIRYLSRSRLIGKDRTAELTVDQLVYQRGQPTTFRVKFVDERFIPTDADGVAVTVERKGEGRQTIKLSRLRELPTSFEGQMARLPEGTYHGWVSQPAFNEAPPSVDFRVEIPQRELLRRGMDRSDLQIAATTSHGRLYTLDDVDQLANEIPRGTPVPLETDEPIPLWNRWEFLTLLTLLLSAEWLLRKRWKLT